MLMCYDHVMHFSFFTVIFLAVGLMLFNHKIQRFNHTSRHPQAHPPRNGHTYEPYWAFYCMAAGASVMPICVLLITTGAIKEYRNPEEVARISQRGDQNYGTIELDA